MRDVDSFHSAFSDPEVTRYDSYMPHTERSETETHIMNIIKRDMRHAESEEVEGELSHTRRCEEFVIERIDRLEQENEATDKEATIDRMPSCRPCVPHTPSHTHSPLSFTPVGKVSYYHDRFDRMQLSYMIFRCHWRLGYASEAVGTLLEYLFRTRPELSTDMILADIDPRNVASRGLLEEKFGFAYLGEQEATMQVGGVWMDSLYLGCGREQFDASGWKETIISRYGALPEIHHRDDEEKDSLVTTRPDGHHSPAAAAPSPYTSDPTSPSSSSSVSPSASSTPTLTHSLRPITHLTTFDQICVDSPR